MYLYMFCAVVKNGKIILSSQGWCVTLNETLEPAVRTYMIKTNLVLRVFVPLDQRSENESSGSNHFEITKEITEFWKSGFTAQFASMAHAWNDCSQSSRCPTAGQGERRLWERDWIKSRLIIFLLPVNVPVNVNPDPSHPRICGV